MKKFFLILFLYSIALAGFSQQISYVLKAGGIKIGDFYIEQHQFNDTTIFLIETNVTLNFIISKYKVRYTAMSIYNGDILLEAYVRAVENDELNKYTQTSKTESGYHVKKIEDVDEDTVQYNFKHTGITLSSTKVFYNQPSTGDSSYAELYGNFGDINEKKPNQIEITNRESGSKTIYYFENGLPVKRRIPYPILDFLMFSKEVTTVSNPKDSVLTRFGF